MQLVTKTVKGHKYWYAVQKGRRGKTVTNVRTIYLGTTATLLQRLGLGDAEDAGSDALLPAGFWSQEAGASTALWELAVELGLPALINEVCGHRRADAAVSFGDLLTILAIQRAIAGPGRKSLRRAREWFSSCRLSRLVRVDAAGLDFRRIYEAQDRLDARTIEGIEDAIAQRVVDREDLNLAALAFDATNFDSYAASTTPSRLLKRGHAKSKKANPRVLGMGLLVTADDGIPLLSFAYPGNKADVTSFKSFLARLRRRLVARHLGHETTVVCDGGNISKEVVARLEKQEFRYAARLPTGHAPQADALRTADLPVIKHGEDNTRMAAKAIRTTVYGKERTVVTVYSEAMKRSQVPGFERDIKKAEKDLQALEVRLCRQAAGQVQERHRLDAAQSKRRAADCLTRQYMAKLFTVQVGGSDKTPELTWKFDKETWQDIQDNRLGRTTVVTNRTDWSPRQVVDALAEQSHAEAAFRQLKDRQWTSALPLACRSDRQLRVHAFVAVLALILATVLRRRLRKRQIDLSVAELLAELSDLRYGFLQYSLKAPGSLQQTARSKPIPPSPTPLQRRLVRALRIGIELGPTKKSARAA